MAEYELHHDEDPQTQATRRAVLQTAIGVGLAGTALSTLYVGVGLIPKKEITPEKEPIAAGDILVYGKGDPKEGQPITVADLKLGQKQLIAYPMNPGTKVIKGGEATNTVIVLKLDPSKLDAETTKLATEGIVAYSGVCKHLGCIVSNWDQAEQVLICPCHVGKYDPKTRAKVVGGPPPGPVPQLPIKVEGGQIVVAGEFTFEAGKV
jgi:rieske iron-sulfur protein